MSAGDGGGLHSATTSPASQANRVGRRGRSDTIAGSQPIAIRDRPQATWSPRSRRHLACPKPDAMSVRAVTGSCKWVTPSSRCHTRYDAYGSILESPGTLEQPYTYTGREFDAESGLSYYRARNYDPSSGRFLQKDPIGFSGGDINLYNYVGNNPARWIDPLGLFYPGDFVGGLGDMISGRSDMMDAGTKGADAYFHCRANCQASRRGLGGYHAAVIASALREMIQNEPPADRARDEAANAQGQCAGNNNPSADCYKGCDNLIPPSGIPQRHLPPHADPRHRYQPAGTPP